MAEIQDTSYKRGTLHFSITKPVTQRYKEMEIIIDNSLAILGAVTLVLLLLGGIYWNIILHVLLQKIKGDVRSLDGTVGKLIQLQSEILERSLAKKQTIPITPMSLDHVSIDMGDDFAPDLSIGTCSDCSPPITDRSVDTTTSEKSFITAIRAPGVASSPRYVVSLEGFWGLTIKNDDA